MKASTQLAFLVCPWLEFDSLQRYDCPARARRAKFWRENRNLMPTILRQHQPPHNLLFSAAEHPSTMSDDDSSNGFPKCVWDASEYRTNNKREDKRSLDVSKLGNPTKVKALPWSGHLKALLCGVKDPNCILNAFVGAEETIIKNIYSVSPG